MGGRGYSGSAIAARARAGPSTPLLDADLEQLRPALPGDEDALLRRVVRDAVQAVLVVAPLAVGEQPPQVDDRDDVARLGIDAQDLVLVPDVGPDLALDPLELVELALRHARGAHAHAAADLQRLRVDEAQLVAARRRDQARAVGRQAPTFAFEGERADLLQVADGVDERDAFSPRQL